MNNPKYDLSSSTDYTFFEFKSNGTNGVIDKRITYTIINDNNLYNLGFGDYVFDEETKSFSFNDLSVSANGDTEAVLSTVARSVYVFTETYPERYVFFRGSTNVRTRLYRMAISLNMVELSKTFYIFGVIKDENGVATNVPFDKNGNFYGFIIKRK